MAMRNPIRTVVVAAGCLAAFLVPAAAVSAQTAPVGAALRPHLYWAKNGGTITRASLKGTGVRRLVTHQDGPVGVAVGNGHLYWADNNSGTIMAANLDGTGVTTLVSGQPLPEGIAVG